ncbi:glutamate racemase [Spirulina sp. CS-785/01]|uniref:glutamate racemase n=1 Tax=Spirulina sp. CS-785/01 TaxID=3021716 RepID=UPI00232F6334|nr:glutamate racemase [Spirulina sp. CS-785/01]MDB9313133.1 glutamate racemase [Spirulina sp. CS-785/01]
MKQVQQNQIGVFDSGVGGLTVLRQLKQQLPEESFLYFADTARLPYGTRTKEEILQFVREILTWMQAEGVKMVIMACNTSSALALEEVRQEFPFPVLGLILPGARAAIHQGRSIGVIATPATVASNAYQRAILEADAGVEVFQVGCPEFVPLIEQNRLTDVYTYQIAEQYLQPLLDRSIDTLIYGCTHYPHLNPVIKRILPPAVKTVNPAYAVAIAAEKELQLLSLQNTNSPLPTRFCVSGEPQQFALLSQQFLGEHPHVEKVSLQSTHLPACRFIG